MWLDRSERGVQPRAGGWLSQPLDLLVTFDVLDLLRDTKRYMQAEGADWSKLTAIQRDLIAWADGKE